jgi:hypothetical protein
VDELFFVDRAVIRAGEDPILEPHDRLRGEMSAYDRKDPSSKVEVFAGDLQGMLDAQKVMGECCEALVHKVDPDMVGQPITLNMIIAMTRTLKGLTDETD